MSILPIPSQRFMYEAGLDRIKRSYEAASQIMEQKHLEASMAYKVFMASGTDDREYDEDGILVRSTDSDLSYDQMDAAFAVSVVREAFVMSAFHYWEGWARSWSKLRGPGQGFDKLMKALDGPYKPHPDMEWLNHLNNHLKHHSAYHARKLAEYRPDFLKFPPLSVIETKQSVISLAVRHIHMREIFKIIECSGPKDI